MALFDKVVKLIFGDKQARDRKLLQPTVDEINVISKELEGISDEELRNKTSDFRRLLGVTIRMSRVQDQVVVHEQAENVLDTHPDLEKTVFVGTRRDTHAGEIAAWVKVKEGFDSDLADLAVQIRGGMTRLGPGYAPKHVFFVDRFPMEDDERGRKKIDHHSITLATEQWALEDWEKVTWDEVEKKLQREESSYEVMDLLPEAFATIKEVCRRLVGSEWEAGGNMIEWAAIPYDVQLMGATSLAKGNISEMATGEGKTLTAIMPLYLHALTGKGSHLVTVNDYLAKRDAEWNTPFFAYLGMTVGCLDKTDPHTPQRRMQYQADVTYGTVNEFGFDHLRDNMVRQKAQLVQKVHAFCIIDEVDSVLIDEARTPLIISGPVDRSTAQYDKIIPQIRELVNKQNMLVSQMAKESEDLLVSDDDDKRFEAGMRLLQCFKGSPKHNRYMKLRMEPSNQRLQDKVEMQLMSEKKMGGRGSERLKALEEELFFLVDDRNRQIELTDKGRNDLSPNDADYFILQDIVDNIAKIDYNEEISEEEREKAKRDARNAHDQKAEELHTISQLLNAFVTKIRDIDYVIEDNKIVIVDENTGRKMAGRRWSDGLHQAVEAKEGVKIEAETQTLAQITIQNYFRMYTLLSGMTGTAETEAAEFHATYDMDVIVIPTNQPCVRKDMDDSVYLSKREKYAAVLNEVERLNKMKLPVLVGTTSVQDSERLSKMFSSRKLEHKVLNAKNHLQEAKIVLEAGHPGAITIATNMAGRGTDIKLGPGVGEEREDPATSKMWPGGLQIVGTERHEARRIDRQLRGRSGRQGDPGSSRFFVSLEDNLMLRFGSEKIAGWLEKLGMKEGEAIENPLVTRSITNAQKKVEMMHHEYRQRTLKFDDVMNGQRTQMYTLRRDLLVEDDVRPTMLGIFEDAIDAAFRLNYGTKANMGDADVPGWIDWIHSSILSSNLEDLTSKSWPEYEELHNAAMERIAKAYDEKVDDLAEIAVPFCRHIGLQTIDSLWQDHLLAIDDLRESVGLRGYGQKDPLMEFTVDATSLFDEFMLDVNKEIFQTYFRAQPMSEEESKKRQRVRQMQEQKPQVMSAADAIAAAEKAKQKAEQQKQKPGKPKSGLDTYRREMPKVGRNDPCPCGSGKKFKQCHGSTEGHEPLHHTVNPDDEPKG
jgi:preprotein translocase subunit SecA